MATFVLVHGGGHGGWCYQPVARILRARGHEVYTPTLTGLGERRHLLSADVDLYMHITDVANVLEFEDLQEVILVGHSYGGMVITGVADRVPDRIANLVYLDAAYPQNGQSLVDILPDLINEARQKARIVDGIELVLFPGEDPMHYFGVTDKTQLDWMKHKLTPHPWRCFEQKLFLVDEEKMRRIPQSFILSSVQSGMLDDISRNTLKDLANGRLWEIPSGHDLMITEPGATALLLMELSGG